MTTLRAVFYSFVLALVAIPAHAQVSAGTVTGRIIDEHGSAVPGVMVQATNAETGLVRQDTTSAEGTYRLAALPVGTYDIVAQREGFLPVDNRGVVINLSRTLTIDITLRIAPIFESVVVSAPRPLISTSSSSIGEVVDLARIQGLPLNGRQFANLAATVPGVGMGIHSDPTKNAQYVPQISGGNGRNVSYVVDGGDNNDDTVGGLLQLYPLEAIQEFALTTHRFDAEHGRSSGGVLNVVTKSGTNDVRGSWFTLLRDDVLNAQTFSEQIGNVGKQEYRRYQYGGSTGGPVVRDRVHYFAAYERTQQNRRQVVNTLGLYPGEDGVFPLPYHENLFTTKLTASARTSHYLSLRYGRDDNRQPSGAGLRFAPSSWSTSSNTFDSMNVNHNWIAGRSALNELVFQYARLVNDIPVTVEGPSLIFPNGVRGGANLGAPQRTEQTKWQVRNDLSWTTGRMGGLSHELKAGVSWVHEPRLFALTGQGTNGIFGMATNALDGPVRSVLVIGGTTSSNIPLDFYGLYVQDTWRVNSRLTLNIGVRWDYVDGMPIDQSLSENFLAMQAAGRTGRFAGTLLDDFGKDPRHDKDNIQPRLGAVFDLRGDGRDIVRGGWGLYTDFAYTNANALTASFDAAGGAGIVFSAVNAAGLRKPDGSFFLVTDPLSSIASLNSIPPGFTPRAGEVVSPVLEQPYTSQTSLGWAHQFNPTTAVSLDYVRVHGRNLNMRVRPNVLVNGVRYLADVPVFPQDVNFRVAVSKGRSQYDGVIVGLRRRLSRGFDASASYTLARATSDVGSAYDEIALNLIQDITDPFGPVQQAPSGRTDSRHQISMSAVVEAPGGIHIAPVFFYRSALPVHTSEGVDLNADGNPNDRTSMAYRYTGLTESGMATYEEAGPCHTVNCSRRAPFSQMNLRVSRSFRLVGTMRIDAIAEVFNLFNARNPSFHLTQTRLGAGSVPNAGFMQPNAFAGDAMQAEQRAGQVGFRLTF
jgi:hypothetical protein